jgi:hypothetical protein
VALTLCAPAALITRSTAAVGKSLSFILYFLLKYNIKP